MVPFTPPVAPANPFTNGLLLKISTARRSVGVEGVSTELKLKIDIDGEPSIPSVEIDSANDGRFGLGQLEEIVIREIIARFDHKNLSVEAAEFANLNPSVEHITKVCHDLLVGPIRLAGARLERVTVWETEKTSCTYPVLS